MLKKFVGPTGRVMTNPCGGVSQQSVITGPTGRVIKSEK